MAYDPNSTYEPPRRAYYNQNQQQAPVQNGYGRHQQDNYGGQENYGQQYDQYGYDNQQYDQGYGQQHGNYDDYGQDMRGGRPAYGSSYADDYGQANGYHDQGYDYNDRQRRQQRPYDSRYQQRSDRGPLQDYDRQPRQQRPPKQQRPAPDRQDNYQTKSRPDPRSGRQYPQDPRPPAQAQRSDRSGRPNGAPPRNDGYHDPRGARGDGASMEQWKARERERMHVEAATPQTKTWDNAFPVFPNIQQKRDRSRPPTAEQTNGNTPPETRSSNDQGRFTAPCTSGGGSGLPREGSYDYNYQEQHAGQQRYEDARYQDQSRSRNEAPLPRPDAQQQSSRANNAPYDTLNGQRLNQEPIYDGDRRRGEPQLGPEQPSFGTQDRYGDRSKNDGVPPPRPSQPHDRGRGAPVPPINTHPAEQPPRPAYMDHQPMSPAHVPPRPSTATGTGDGPRTMTSPIRQDFNDARNMTSPQYAAPRKTGQLPSHGNPGNPPESYQSNAYTPFSQPNAAPPRTREEEIEAEMPDFDSAAPSQTSMLQKRIQTPTSATAPQPMQSYVPPSSVQSLPAQIQTYSGQPRDLSSTSLPESRAGRDQANYADDYTDVIGDYGQAYDQSYEQPSSLQQRRPPHQNGLPPVQPPFANEQQPRRSMDDARQMPYRQGPPPQGYPRPNGQPPRGPPGPPGTGRPPGPPGSGPPRPRRAETDRGFNGPVPRPEPSQQRAGSVPPARRGPQHLPNGIPAARPDHQQPPNSAPPDRQTFGQEQTEGPGNPDSLPYHPVPVRPGLMQHGTPQPAKPPPVRNYDGVPGRPAPKSQPRKPSIDQTSQPVTVSELNQLRATVDANPHNSKQGMTLVKRLVEASTVLASEDGRADQRTAARNRENYIMEAYKRLKRLVAAGYPDAQFYLADCYGQGLLGLEADEKEAFNLYQAAAKGGHPQAAFRTAVCCEIGPEDGGGTRKDYAKAVQWYRRAAALSDVAGMYKLGIVLLRGMLGQQKSIGEAVGWLKRAAERADAENPHALYELAILHDPTTPASPEIRNKILPDENYARDLFTQAAQLGHRSSQFRLGQAYEYGTLGLAIDNRSSIGWYSKAAAKGDHQAELALAGWYLTGAEGILEHSDTEAYLWARKAASSEPPLAKAMYAMGYFTETGIGCPASLEEAKRWYGRAASYNFPKAQERLEELRRNPTKGPNGAGRGAPGGPPPVNGRLTRKDQKRDEAECTVM